MIIGTAAYLAPEQVSASTSDARTDVYAAGVMLFEMLTGAQPHTGETPLDTAYKHVNEVVPPPSVPVAGAAARAGRPGRPGHQPRPGPAAVRRRAVPGGGQRGPARRPAAAAAPRCPRRPRRARGPQRAAGRRPAAPRPRPRPAARDLAASDRPALNPLRDALAQPGPDRAAYPGGPGAAPGRFGPAAAAGPAAGGLGGRRLPGRHRPRPRGDRLGRLRRRAASRRPPDAACAASSPACPAWAATRAAPPPVRWPADGGPDGSGPANHTLVVSAGTLLPGFDDGDYRPRDRRLLATEDRWHREPPLQRLLFSRRLIYILGVLAVVLVAVLVAWWLTAGRYTTDAQGDRADRPGGHLGAEGPALPGPARPQPAQQRAQRPCAEHQPGARRQGQAGRHDHHRRLARPGPDRRPAGDRAADRPGRSGPEGQGPDPWPAQGGSLDHHPGRRGDQHRPVAGTAWPKNKPVGIVVSSGQPLPSFVGQQLAAAQAGRRGRRLQDPAGDRGQEHPARQHRAQADPGRGHGHPVRRGRDRLRLTRPAERERARRDRRVAPAGDGGPEGGRVQRPGEQAGPRQHRHRLRAERDPAHAGPRSPSTSASRSSRTPRRTAAPRRAARRSERRPSPSCSW